MKLLKKWSWDPGSEIRDPEKTYSGSRIQGSKRHRIPDPDPQHCSRLPPLLNVIDGVDSQNIPCATLKRRGSWVISVYLWSVLCHHTKIRTFYIFYVCFLSLSSLSFVGDFDPFNDIRLVFFWSSFSCAYVLLFSTGLNLFHHLCIVADLGCLSRISDPDFYPSRILDPGSQNSNKREGGKKFVIIPLL